MVTGIVGCAILTSWASQQVIASGTSAISASRPAIRCGRWYQRGLRLWALMSGGSWSERQAISTSPRTRGASLVFPIGFVIPEVAMMAIATREEDAMRQTPPTHPPARNGHSSHALQRLTGVLIP